MSYSENELENTPTAIPLISINTSSYCAVHYLPAITSPFAAKNQSIPGMAKVFRLTSAPDIQFNNILVSLADKRDAAPEAYVHKNITPFQIIEVNVMTSLGLQPSQALVTPWYSKGDIRNYLINHPEVKKLPLAIQIGRAVEHLHRYGIVHGNIHPGNIFITDDGHATLADIAVRTQACNLFLLPHAVPPPHIYQAPEPIYSGTDGFFQPTKAADVYAFVLTVLAMYVDMAPFHGRFGNIAQDIAEVSKPEDIDDQLWEDLKPCLNRDALVRPSMTEVLTMLEDSQLYGR